MEALNPPAAVLFLDRMKIPLSDDVCHPPDPGDTVTVHKLFTTAARNIALPSTDVVSWITSPVMADIPVFAFDPLSSTSTSALVGSLTTQLAKSLNLTAMVS